jgi:hypothetical protein
MLQDGRHDSLTAVLRWSEHALVMACTVPPLTAVPAAASGRGTTFAEACQLTETQQAELRACRGCPPKSRNTSKQ